ncbi:unnamed protein product [Ilex paraguariensis]|uniref:Uncharacterized protein n=1 Tax=Ilex paraguariensis TaxID=185542 RepID=A0ABC8S3J0_9AQUA
MRSELLLESPNLCLEQGRRQELEEQRRRVEMVAPGEEGGPKLARLLYFVGAGFICTAAINKWRDLERKFMIQKQQRLDKEGLGQLSENPANAIAKAVE